MSELRAWLLSLGQNEGTEQEIWEASKKKLSKLTANWLINKLLAIASRENVEVSACQEITPENFAEFVTLVYQSKINSTVAQKVLEFMCQSGNDPSVILEEQDLSGGQSDDLLEKIIDDVLKNNPDQVDSYKKGKTTVIQFFIGQVMRQTKGQADPSTIKELLTNKLK